ncbi:hypothetical protein J5N97_014356 [Dioscorea zingiberensis]|uniref:Scarecrow-like protein 3 n=1 Tax=Dioscorea zingiberensis TaxID=325984 RepID=A0A9D5CUL7_9LILI|nr:hypothetical protein J5N97_014356 [Dioscorea zingiberensis]
MIQDEASSSPFQVLLDVSLTERGLAGVAIHPGLRELKSDERGLCLIHLLLQLRQPESPPAHSTKSNHCLENISLLASPDGDTMQRIASLLHTSARPLRVLRSWRGFYFVLNPAAEPRRSPRRTTPLLRAPAFLRLSYTISNQAIMEAMEGEKMVHIIDLSASDPAQWVALFHLLQRPKEGPPHLRITGINEQKELLDHTALLLSEEAERLDIPFQFNPVVAKLDNLDTERLRVKTGEALAIASVLQLHCLLASDDDALPGRPCSQLQGLRQHGPVPSGRPDESGNTRGTSRGGSLDEWIQSERGLGVVVPVRSDAVSEDGEVLVLVLRAVAQDHGGDGAGVEPQREQHERAVHGGAELLRGPVRAALSRRCRGRRRIG